LIFDFSQKYTSYKSESESVSESELFFRIRIQPKHSDYFGFGSTTLLRLDYITVSRTAAN
jgi:hypothetical protein